MLQIYKASAGSGKTYTLVLEYLLQLLRNTKPDVIGRAHEHLLAVTFTKKATAEMKQRIMNELYNLANDKPSNQRKELLQQLNISGEELQQRSRQALINILLRYSRFSVNTIDSFFQQIVRQFSHELGLNGAYTIDLDEKQIQEQAIDDMLFNLTPTDENGNRNALLDWIEQWALNNINEGEAWNPRNNISKLAEQIAKEKIQSTLKDTTAKLHDKVFIASYYKQLYAIIHNYTSSLQDVRQRAQNILNSFSLDKKDFSANTLNPFFKTDIPDSLSNTFIKCIDDRSCCHTKTCKCVGTIEAAYSAGLGECYRQMYDLVYGTKVRDYRTAVQITRHLYAIGLLGDVMNQIDATNQQLGRLPMSDVGYWLERITRQSDTPFVYEKLGQRLTYYMIDEFQDTSDRQWHNFKPLVSERIDSGGSSLIVGDVKQSIYRWRNSDWHLLADKLTTDIPQNHIETKQENYRSSKRVVEFNNSVMKLLSNELQKQFNTYYPDTPHQQTITSAYADATQTAKKELEGLVSLRILDADTFTQQALDLLPEYLQKAINQGARPTDIAILTRTHKEIAQITGYLSRKTYTRNGETHNYKFATQEGLLLTAHPAVLFVIDTLRTVINSNDKTLHLMRHFNYLRGCRQLSASEAMTLACAQTPPYQDTDSEVLAANSSDLFDYLQTIISSYQLDQWSGAHTYLTYLSDIVYQYMLANNSQIASFLEWWDITGCTRSIAAPEMDDAIHILTIHKSKGLEFPVVIVPFCNWDVAKIKSGTLLWTSTEQAPFNQLPIIGVSLSKKLSTTHFKDAYIEERINMIVDSLNLLYVAFTRAVQMLVVLCPQYKEPKNKDDDTYSNIGGQLSKLIAAVVSELQEASDIKLSDNQLEYGNPNLTINIEKDSTAEEQPLGRTYQIGDRLQQKSSSAEYLADSEQLNALNLGTLMHELLARLTTHNDLHTELKQMEDDGRITTEQKHQLKAEAEKFFKLIEHTDWFKPVWDRVLCEQDIILPHNTNWLKSFSEKTGIMLTKNNYRPDRIMIRGNNAVIIDYKFGKHQLDIYKKQVANYMQLLSEIGYNTEGNLVYVELAKIEQVKNER